MALRPDEEFVKECLLKHLGAIKAWQGEDPPDIYIELKEKNVAVEITRLSPISFDHKGIPQNRMTQDFFARNLCDDLNTKLGGAVPAEFDIILVLYVPVPKAKQYKKELHAYLQEILAKGMEIGDRLETDLSGEKVKVCVVPRRDHSEKRIVGIVVNSKSNAHILSNTQVILTDRIRDKVEKCRKIQFDGPIWLAMFNDYFLADHETYAQVLENGAIQHDFERIYIISDTATVHQIY